MSARGIYAWKYKPASGFFGDAVNEPCLIIGLGVPQIHLPGNLPTYMITEHHAGEDRLVLSPAGNKASMMKLIAYPTDWPVPGYRNEDWWIKAQHELLTWSGMVPLFDIPRAKG